LENQWGIIISYSSLVWFLCDTFGDVLLTHCAYGEVRPLITPNYCALMDNVIAEASGKERKLTQFQVDLNSAVLFRNMREAARKRIDY